MSGFVSGAMNLWSKAIFQPCHRHVLHPIDVCSTGERFFKCHYDSICRLMHQIFYTTWKNPSSFSREIKRDSNSSRCKKRLPGHKGKQMKKHRCQQGVDLFLNSKNLWRPGQFFELVSTWPRHHLFGVWRKIWSASVKSILGNRFFFLFFLFYFLDNFVSFVPGQNG